MAPLALPLLVVSGAGGGGVGWEEVGTNYWGSAGRQIRLYMFLSSSVAPLFVDCTNWPYQTEWKITLHMIVSLPEIA